MKRGKPKAAVRPQVVPARQQRDKDAASDEHTYSDSRGKTWTMKDKRVSTKEVDERTFLRIVAFTKVDKFGNAHSVNRSYKVDTEDPNYCKDPENFFRIHDAPS